MRSVNYQDNSKVTHIGQLLKGTSSNQWRMNVATYPFMPDDRRTDVFSLLPFFARGRILNQTKLVSTDCSEETFLAPIVDEFKEVTLGVFPELSPDSKYIEELESKQMAFSWSSKMNETDITIILPQLELARVTVLQIPFLCRGCTNSTSLLMNFDCSYDSAVSTFNINVFNNSAFPASTLQSEGVRNILAWMLYDKDAKNSFESINRNLQREKVISGNWECWNFRFDLPNISGWKFKCLGRYSIDKTKYFVDEIIGLEIDSDMPMNIVFKGKDFIENINYEGNDSTISKSSAKQSNRFELDMNAHPNDEWIPHFTDPKFTCSFTRPFTSTVERKQRYISNADRTTREGFSDSASRKASTGETTIKGSDKPVSVGGAREGESNNKILMDRFKLFSKVVDRLEQNPLVKIYERDIIHSLCKIGKSRLHRLSDRSIRCIQSVKLSYSHNRNVKEYILLEVDVSDGISPLSTLILPAFESADWPKIYKKIREELVRNSLSWPTEHLNYICKKTSRSHLSAQHPRANEMEATCDDTIAVASWARNILRRL